MQDMNNNGVVISPREMYDLLLRMSNAHQEILSRLKVIEDQLRSVQKTDERSREALDIAEDAKDLALKLERQLFWLWRTLIATSIATAAEALFNIFHH